MKCSVGKEWLAIIVRLTPEERTQLPDGDVSLAHVLAEPHLQEHERGGPADQVEEVWDEERPAAVLVAEVGEAPDVTQSHGEPGAGQQELPALAPDITLDSDGGDAAAAAIIHGRQLLVDALRDDRYSKKD